MRVVIKMQTNKMQALLYHLNVHKLLRVSGLTGPSPGSAQLYKIIVRPYIGDYNKSNDCFIQPSTGEYNEV